MSTEKKAFTEMLMKASIPLKKVDSNANPIGAASGCLIDYLGMRIVLSVFHATKQDGNWAIELKYERGKGTQLYRPGAFHYLGEMRLGSSQIEPVDFSYREVPSDLEAFFQVITPNGEVVTEIPRIILKPDFNILPNTQMEYGFAGLVNSVMHGNLLFVSDFRAYHSLKYVGTEGSFHVFETPIPHPGHKHFRGCSGAPILDTNGNLVALVSHGEIDRNAIFGISLVKCKVALDVTYSNQSNA